MAIADFGSLHAGMMERRSTKGDFDSGKVVKTLAPVPASQPKIEFRRARSNMPPIRSFLDQAADWTELPAEPKLTSAKPSEGPQTLAPAPVSNVVGAEYSSSDQAKLEPVNPERAAPKDLAFVRNAQPETHSFVQAELGDSGQKRQPRRALTLRLDHESHRRLRLASAGLGRSCQDLLYNAMASYLSTLGFVEPTEGDE